MGAEEEGARRSEPPPGASEPAARTPRSSLPPIPLDADDTLGHHFRDLAGRTLTISLAATAAIAAFVIGTSYWGAGIGAAAAAGAALISALVVYAIARGRAEKDFFIAYATGRGLVRRDRSDLPPLTPLLRKGDRRHAEHVMDGTLPSGLPGTLAHFTYQEDHHDSKGRRQTTNYNFTVVLHDLPPVAPRLADLHCQRRSGFRFMDSAEDVFRRMQRLELESEALDRRYEVFFGAADDENWMKQLFSPSFIVWLAEEAPDDFAFEFSAGALCVSVKGHADSAAELDRLCEAAGRVASRLAEEAAE